MKINEVIIDNENGLGGVSYNQEIDYLGLRVLMYPSTFLSLAYYRSRNDLGNVDYIKNYIKNGGTIGAPFLQISIPNRWENDDYSIPSIVIGHEGRNRMMALDELQDEGLEPDVPVETHLLFYKYRARHLKPEWIIQLNKQLYNQNTEYVHVSKQQGMSLSIE